MTVPTGTKEQSPGLLRALWMRATPAVRQVLGEASSWPQCFDFCAAPHGEASARISLLYLEPPAGLGEQALRGFLAAAHARGLKVEFLYCDRDWQPAHLARAKEMCAARIGGEGQPQERFDGLHLLLENQGKWSQQAFHELLRFLRGKLDEHNELHSGKLTLAADLGFWWTERGDDNRPQFAEAVKQCDYLVTLAFRDTAGAQASCAVPQAAAAAKQRKPLFIGAETQWLANQDFVTYYEEGWEQMERELAKLPGLVAGHGGKLAGIAIRQYDSYVQMSRERLVSPYPDVRMDHWAIHSILAVRRAGIIMGYPDGRYAPDEVVTREQMAVFVTHALLGREHIPDGPPTPSFADVPPDYWAYRWVECAKAQGLTLGCEDGLFHPQEPLTRAQLAAFLARALATPPGEAGLASYAPPGWPTFADVAPDGEWAWCYRHVEYLASRGVFERTQDGLFHPEGGCTRDQIAVYLARGFGLLT